MNKANSRRRSVIERRLNRSAAKRPRPGDKTTRLDVPGFIARMLGRRRLRSIEADPVPRYRHD
jgi:hypothetical protein